MVASQLRSPEELHRAVWLAVGGRDPQTLPTATLAAGLGVSRRTVQRCLRGEVRSSAGSMQSLREAVSPPPEVLARQAMERRHLEAQIVAMNSPRGRAISHQARDMGWHRPHQLWHLAHPDLGVYRLMVTMRDTIKTVKVPPRWEVVAVVTLDHRPLAQRAKFDVLDAVSPWRVTVRPELLDKGRHEVWLDTAPAVDLTQLLAGRSPVRDVADESLPPSA